jgi:hypothetical protein
MGVMQILWKERKTTWYKTGEVAGRHDTSTHGSELISHRPYVQDSLASITDSVLLALAAADTTSP